MTRKIEGVDIESLVGDLGDVGMLDRYLVLEKGMSRMLGQEALEALILMNHDQYLVLNQGCREFVIREKPILGLRYHAMTVVESLSSNLPVPVDFLHVYDQLGRGWTQTLYNHMVQKTD